MQQRKAFLKALLTALITNGRIRTTVPRAKTLKTMADKLVTQAKRGLPAGRQGTIASRRLLLRSVGTAAANKLFKDIAPKFALRAGGYTRVVKLASRTSDAAPMAIIEFVGQEPKPSKTEKAEKPATK